MWFGKFKNNKCDVQDKVSLRESEIGALLLEDSCKTQQKITGALYQAQSLNT